MEVMEIMESGSDENFSLDKMAVSLWIQGTSLRLKRVEERLEGDLVLQNGEGIFTLQLGFPFRTKLKPQALLCLRKPMQVT